MGSKKRRFADDGWALWIDGDDRSTIYLNEWINPKGRNYVDISVRVYGAKEAKEVNFFVPFEIEKNEIADLSYMLSDSSALRALFNTNGKVDSEKTKYTSELRYDNRTVSLINLANEFIKVKKISYGTVITVDFEFIKDFITSDEAYLIFRIPHKTLDKIFAPVIDVGSMFDRINSLIQSPVISEKYGYSSISLCSLPIGSAISSAMGLSVPMLSTSLMPPKPEYRESVSFSLSVARRPCTLTFIAVSMASTFATSDFCLL